MPTLKQLTCHVEKGPSNVPLREYATKYHDGVVSTFVGVPSKPTPFTVHLKSNGYIAGGLAMFVFIDGDYQCNRNRRDLIEPIPGDPTSKAEIDFRVRQKEVKTGIGEFTAYDWKFEALDTGT